MIGRPLKLNSDFTPRRRTRSTSATFLPESSDRCTCFTASLLEGRAGVSEATPSGEGSAPEVFRFSPASNGLVPWADYEGIASLCWLSRGDDPDTWPVVAYRDDGVHEYVPGDTIEALLLVLQRQAGRSVFPDSVTGFPGDPVPCCPLPAFRMDLPPTESEWQESHS